jgi:hypothetical protein
MIWPDKDFPALCPISYLLLYLFKAKIAAGYLFPHPSLLDRAVSTNGPLQPAEKHIPYDTFERALQTQCTKLFGDVQKWGTHTCRKTFYLLAVWGGGGDADIMMSARHKSISNSVKYRRDAATLLEIWRNSEENYGLIAPKWQPILITSLQSARRLNRSMVVNQQSLQSLALIFAGFCKIDSESSILDAVKKVNEYSSPITATQLLLQFCESNLSALQSLQLRDILTKLRLLEAATQLAENSSDMSVSTSAAYGSNSQTTITTESATLSTSITQVDPESTANTKKKRGGANNLDIRLQISNLAIAKEKLALLCEINASLPNLNISELTDGARQWTIRSLNPIINCFQKHFKSEKEGFLEEWAKIDYSHSKFITEICDGKHDDHGITSMKKKRKS